MDKFFFDSRAKISHAFRMPEFSETQIKNEPMLFSCNLPNAYVLGGPITKMFLSFLSQEYPHVVNMYDFIVDSRVHMLMPHWYPCIPGFHHDDVQRHPITGQPDYNNFNRKRPEHVMCLLNGDICPTKFAIGESFFDDVPEGEVYYKHWHKEVERQLEKGILEPLSAPSNLPIFFNDESWHTGIKAIKSGWRWFIRCSWNTTRRPVNEVRRQVQVYLENPMEGW